MRKRKRIIGTLLTLIMLFSSLHLPLYVSAEQGTDIIDEETVIIQSGDQTDDLSGETGDGEDAIEDDEPVEAGDTDIPDDGNGVEEGEVPGADGEGLDGALDEVLPAITLFNEIVPVGANASGVYADWIFDSNHSSGSISDGSLAIADQSGNGNALAMQYYSSGTKNVAITYEDYIAFSDESMSSELEIDTTGSISLTPSGKTGVDFITAASAPINAESFTDGYTIEFIYKMPSNVANWAGLMARQGWASAANEPELGTMSVALSDSKAVQFKTADAANNAANMMNRDAWTSPVATKQRDAWYHIAITSNGDEVEIYVNGMSTVRGYYNELIGMYADPADGRFRIGSAYWYDNQALLLADTAGVNGLDILLAGNLERVRISDGVLTSDDWLIEGERTEVLHSMPAGNLEAFAMEDTDNYNMVIIPDTQYVIQGKSSVAADAMDWLADNKDATNIEAIVHLGDITESNSASANSLTEEWDNATAAFYGLAESGFRSLMVRGNHDNTDKFVEFFGPDSDWASTIETSHSGLVVYEPVAKQSSYMIFEAGSYKYMMISLAYGRCTSSTDLPWLTSVLEANPGMPTIITSHDLANTSFGTSATGTRIWNIAKQYDQVFMMIGGHYNGHGYSELINDSGNAVFNILADYQDEYYGGNAYLKFAEFDEDDGKIYLSTFSPYVASKDEEDVTYFDSTYLTETGNYDVLSIDFEERFDWLSLNSSYRTMLPGGEYQLTATAMTEDYVVEWSSSDTDVASVDQDGKVIAIETGSAIITASAYGWAEASCRIYVAAENDGSWMAGEYHVHSGMSGDVNNVSYATVENLLDAAFEQNGMDYLIMADHLRPVNNYPDGSVLSPTIALYKGLDLLLAEIEALKASGKYEGKILYPGFEMDLLGFDHVSVAILPDEGDEVLIEAIKQFEYLYSKNTTADQFTEEEIALWGGRQNANERINAYAAISWLEENYPNSYMLLNHPSRYSGMSRSDELTITEIRIMNDLAPEVVFGFEGIPGNQMSADGARGELPYGYVYGGADVMIAEVGGVWDALLGEGREFWNFANSDFHFKVSDNGRYGSGYWPGEYTKNHSWVEGNDVQAIASALRSGKSFAVMGDLINELDYTIHGGAAAAEMGEHLGVTEGDEYTITIRFKSPATNNYAPITEGHDGGVTNVVSVDHVDLITGEVAGKISPDDPDYDKATNDTTVVLARFTSDDWTVDEEGYNVITYTVDSADTDRYYRLRGTNLGTDVEGMTENGEPLADVVISVNTSSASTAAPGHNAINDRNYSNMWFYSNPIFVDVAAAEPVPDPESTPEPEPEPEIEYTVAFIANGGSAVSSITAKAETLIAEAPVTLKTGYNFIGWYSDAALTETVTFPYAIAKDITLYAGWTRIETPDSSDDDSDNDSDDDSGSSSVGTAASDPVPPDQSSITDANVSVNGYIVSSQVNDRNIIETVPTDEELDAIIEASGEDGDIIVDAGYIDGVSGIIFNIDAAKLLDTSKQNGIEKGVVLMLNGYSVSIPSELIGELAASYSGITSISITQSNGSATVSITVDGREMDWHSYSYPVIISIPVDSGNEYSIVKDASTNEVVARSWYSDGVVYAKVYSAGTYAYAAGSVVAFSDTSGLWMDEAVRYMAARGIVSGIGDNLFAPDRAVTRAEFVTMLINSLNPAQRLGSAEQFGDVSQDAYYYDALLMARVLGITNGVGDNNFAPDAAITRQDAFVMTYNALNAMNMLPDQYAGSVGEFADWENVADYANAPMEKLVKLGLISGSGGNINPVTNATRAESVQFLYNILVWDTKQK